MYRASIRNVQRAMCNVQNPLPPQRPPAHRSLDSLQPCTRLSRKQGPAYFLLPTYINQTNAINSAKPRRDTALFARIPFRA